MARSLISEKLIKCNLKPLNVIHPTAILDKTCKIGEGLQVMPGACVNYFSKIGDFVILNTSSTVDHECIIGKGVHIMGNAYVGGRVKIGDFVHWEQCNNFSEFEIKKVHLLAGSWLEKCW